MRLCRRFNLKDLKELTRIKKTFLHWHLQKNSPRTHHVARFGFHPVHERVLPEKSNCSLIRYLIRGRSE
mgnify:CR=1 FL=1